MVGGGTAIGHGTYAGGQVLIGDDQQDLKAAGEARPGLPGLAPGTAQAAAGAAGRGPHRTTMARRWWNVREGIRSAPRLFRTTDSTFVSIFAWQWTPIGGLTYVNAGHNRRQDDIT
jgi:hypothetical protein